MPVVRSKHFHERERGRRATVNVNILHGEILLCWVADKAALPCHCAVSVEGAIAAPETFCDSAGAVDGIGEPSYGSDVDEAKGARWGRDINPAVAEMEDDANSELVA
jgi:hypothetical protein